VAFKLPVVGDLERSLKVTDNVTMSLSYIISKIKQDIHQKLKIFHTSYTGTNLFDKCLKKTLAV